MILALLLGLAQAQAATNLQTFLTDVDQFRQADKILGAEVAKSRSANLAAWSKKLFFTPTVSAGITRNFGRTKTLGYDNEDRLVMVENAFTSEKNFGISANWNLFRGGSDYFSMLSADAAKDAQAFSALSQATQVEVKASEIIFRKVFFYASYQANLEQKKLKESAMQIAKERYRQGRISLQELDRIEIDLSQQLNRMRQLEMEKLDLEQRIRSSFVQKIDTDSWPLANARIERLQLGAKSNETQKLYWQSQASKYGWRSASLRHLPTVDLNFTYSRSNPAGEEGSFFGYYGRNQGWAGVFTVTLPIWSQLATTSEIAAERANYEQTDAAFSVAENEELARRDALAKKIPILKESVLESQKVLKKAEDLYKATMRGFQYGKVSTNDLFLEQSRLIDTRLEYSQNQMNLHTTLVEACALSGKSLRECLSSAL